MCTFSGLECSENISEAAVVYSRHIGEKCQILKG